MKKYFTLEEARENIPEIRKSVVRIAKVMNSLHLLKTVHVEYHHEDEAILKDIQEEKEFFRLNYLLSKEIEEITKKGVILRDPSVGLVDFPSQVKGKEIFFCWHAREPTVEYWHERDSGFQNRKHISELE